MCVSGQQNKYNCKKENISGRVSINLDEPSESGADDYILVATVVVVNYMLTFNINITYIIKWIQSGNMYLYVLKHIVSFNIHA